MHLFEILTKPFVMVIENYIEDCGVCMNKAIFPGKSFMAKSDPPTGNKSTPKNSVIEERRVRVLLIENETHWMISRQIVDSYRAKTALYVETSNLENVEAYLSRYNPLFWELIELSPTKKVYGIKLEDLKRTFSCKTAWENKDWICIEESDGPIPGAVQT